MSPNSERVKAIRQRWQDTKSKVQNTKIRFRFSESYTRVVVTRTRARSAAKNKQDILPFERNETKRHDEYAKEEEENRPSGSREQTLEVLLLAKKVESL